MRTTDSIGSGRTFPATRAQKRRPQDDLRPPEREQRVSDQNLIRMPIWACQRDTGVSSTVTGTPFNVLLVKV